MSETVTQVDQAALGTAAAARPQAATPRRLRGILCLEDFEEPARRFLPRPIFGYISGGVEIELVARRQPRSLQRVRVPAARARQHPRPPSEDDALRAHLRSAVRLSADGRHVARRLHGRHRPREGRGGAQHGHDPERRVAHDDGARQGGRARPRGSRRICRASRRSSRRSSSARSGRASKCSCSRWTCRCPRTARTTCAPATARRSSRRRVSRGTACCGRAGCSARSAARSSNHGMPHLENMGFPRIPIVGNSIARACRATASPGSTSSSCAGCGRASWY